MARQSSGIYQSPANTDAVSGQTISSTKYNSLTGDLGNEITNSLDRQGRGAMQADLDHGGFKGTNAADPTLATDISTKGYTDTLVSAHVPPGSISMFGASSPPSGWLECDGSAVSRTTYANLFSAIGTTWGAGNGSTTFNLPDMRGYFPRGYDHGAGVDPVRVFASSQADEFKAHNHEITDPTHAHNYTPPVGDAKAAGATSAANVGGAGTGLTSFNKTDITINNSGGTETRPKNKAVLFIIRT